MSKWIDFIEIESTGKTKVFNIVAKEDQAHLGKIKWYGPWKCYTFQPNAETIYEKDCLKDITEFILKLENDRKTIKENTNEMKHLRLYEEFSFPSNLEMDQCVNFIPMAKQAEEHAITRETRFGKIVAVRFTKAKVFYDVLDDYLGIIFPGVDSALVEPSKSREKLEEK